MVYHAEIPTIQAQSFYSVLGLAASTDAGLNWTDLGEIIRVNQAYRTDLDGFDIGDPPLVLSPDGEYFYIYFEDWLANGTTHWGTTLTLASVLAAGIGGYSTDLNPSAGYSGELQVAYSAALQRYVMIVGEGTVAAYAESPDGLNWTLPSLLFDFSNEPGQPRVYVAPVGAGWNGASLSRLTISCQ